MLNSKILHRLKSSGHAVIPNFLFHPSFIAPRDSLIYERYVSPVISSGTGYIVFHPDIPWQAEALAVIKAVIASQSTECGRELLVSMLLQKLWILITENLSFDTDNDKMTALYRTRLQLMMQYIHFHYAEDITLDDIAEAAGIAGSTALLLFRSNLKITPVNYLIAYRLKQAARLLVSTEKKISAVASESGFNNPDYFCRSFRKAYGMTPTEYRRHGVPDK